MPTIGPNSIPDTLRLHESLRTRTFGKFRQSVEVPNLLLQKFPAEEFTVTAKVKISSKADGQQSGLIVMGHDYCTLGLEKNGEKFDLVQTVCHDAEQGGAETRTLVTDMSPSRRYEAACAPNYERDIYLRYGWTRAANAHSVIASTA